MVSNLTNILIMMLKIWKSMRNERNCFLVIMEKSLSQGLKMVLQEVQRIERTLPYVAGTLGLSPSTARTNHVALDS